MNRYYAEDFHDTSLQAAKSKTGLFNDIEGAGCFVAGTKIFTSLGWKPIEKIKVGALVIAYDALGNIEHGYVQQLHVHKKNEQKHSIIKFTLADNTVLEVTGNHGMWQDNEETPFIEAKTLRVGDTLFNIEGNPIEITGRKVTALKNKDEDFCSYNLSVHPQHTYIAEGIRVHNGGGDKSGQQRTPVESPNTLRSRSVVKIQEFISEGEVEGLVDAGRSVSFDDTPIINADDSPNFEDVSFFFFTGTPDQVPMPGFSDVEAEQVVNVEMLPPPSPGVVQTLPGGTDAARITVQLPGGLFDTDTGTKKATGDINGHTVDIKIETRLTGGVFQQQMIDTITGKTMSVYERDYRIDAPQPYDGIATWEVRVSRLSAGDAKVTTKSTTFFARLTEIQEIEIAYENICIAGLQVDAKATGGNVPIRSYDIKGIKVQVPTNYDPITRVYDGVFTGAFKIEYTDNPAWHVYDLLTNERYGLGQHIDSATIDPFSFYDAAQYNDELVDDGDGGTEPRFTFNTQIAVQEDAWKLVQAVASSMRATVLPGTILTLLQDRPASVALLINNSNVIDGMFTYTGSALASRKTVAHVTFNDPDDRFLPRTVTEDNTVGLARYGFNPTDIAAFGCTSEGQARRLAKWVLDTELNTAEVVVFNVALDNAHMLPGDIIKIMDRDYAGLEIAGRVAGGTDTVIDLDREVTLEAGATYTFSVIDADNEAISERTVTTGAGDVTQITVTPALLDTGVALKSQVWMLESDIGVVARQFRVLFMRELEKGKFEISASRHDPGKYARVETGITLPDQIYSDLPGSVVAEIETPTYEVQAYTDPNFGDKIRLIVKWTHNDRFTHKFKIQWRFQNGNFSEPIYREEREFEIGDITPGTYEVMISAINTRGVSSVPVIDEFTYAPGVDNTMDPPINLIITVDTQDANNVTSATPDFSFQFENNPDNDPVGGPGVFGGIAGYTIVIQDDSFVEIDRRQIGSVPNKDPFFQETFNFADNAATAGGPHREINVLVFTRTADGAISTSAISKTFTNPFPPAPGTSITATQQGAFIQVTPTGEDRDTAGMVVVAKEVGGDYTPVEGDILYQGPDLTTQLQYTAAFESRSIRAAVFDTFSFNFADLQFSTFAIQPAGPYGIQKVTLLPTLPNILYPDGVQVYLTTDRKLYRVTLNGTVWDRSADGADLFPESVTTNEILTGTIVASDISSQTLSTASGVFLDLGVDTASIADLSVTTVKLPNGAITNIASQTVGFNGVKTAFAGTDNGDFPVTGIPPVTWITIASVVMSIDSTASEMVISANIDATVVAGGGGGSTRGSEFIGTRIRRDGLQLWSGLSDIGRTGGWVKDFALIRSAAIATDGNIVGNHTYTLDIFGQTKGTGPFTEYYYFQNTLTVTESKK